MGDKMGRNNNIAVLLGCLGTTVPVMSFSRKHIRIYVRTGRAVLNFYGLCTYVLKMTKVVILKNQNHSRARFGYVFGKRAAPEL